MANPQKENGYTAIANEILEHIVKARLNATQFRIIMVVWRYTYGFKRKEHDLSAEFLAEAIGSDRRQIRRELKALEEKGIIFQIIKPCVYRKIGFNKDYSQWQVLTGGESTPRGESTPTAGGESTLSTRGESTPQERKKEKFKESIYMTPEKFFNSNLGLITPFIAEAISHWISDGVEPELIVRCMEIAVSRGVRTWAYINTIIRNNFDKNIKTLEQYESSQVERTYKKKKSKFELLDEMVDELEREAMAKNESPRSEIHNENNAKRLSDSTF